MLTRHDVIVAVDRVVAAFGAPFGNKPDAVVREWHRALEHRGQSADLDAAVSDVIGEATKFPTVAQVRAAMDARARARRSTGHSPAAPSEWPACAMCRSEYVYAGYEMGDGRVVGRLRCRCAKSGQTPGWRTPAARAWRETDARLQERDWRETMHEMAGRTMPDEATIEAKRAAMLRALGDAA